MELTAKTLQEVTFGAKVRGYDPAEVDEFIAAVAEGVEELHERLRRATERATRAEQQLAAQAEAPAPVAEPAAPASASPEISKVWERAVAAAEQAMEEAKAEAQRLLDEARSRADTQLNDARREAETTVSAAKSEAQRITEESQAQLKIEIQRLEAARESLTADVNGLSSFLDSERERLKARLNEAMSAIEQYGSGGSAGFGGGFGSGAAPLVDPASSSFLGDAAPVTTASDDWTSVSVSTSAAEPEWKQPLAETPTFDYSGTDEDNESEESAVPDWARSENADQLWTTSEPQSGSEDDGENAEPSWQVRESTESVDDTDVDGDPFLAELRRAVQDDGPLGPRDDDDDTSLSDLYAADDDDKGFFRRNK